MKGKGGPDVGHALDRDEVREVLRDTFYRDDSAKRKRQGGKLSRKAKPDHYEVICISLYREDLNRLDTKVADLKQQGHRKMSRSALIRFALDQVDVTKLPKSY